MKGGVFSTTVRVRRLRHGTEPLAVLVDVSVILAAVGASSQASGDARRRPNRRRGSCAHRSWCLVGLCESKTARQCNNSCQRYGCGSHRNSPFVIGDKKRPAADVPRRNSKNPFNNRDTQPIPPPDGERAAPAPRHETVNSRYEGAGLKLTRDTSLLPLNPSVDDTAPTEAALTPYDRKHLVTYMRLLDADADGADWKEVARIVLQLDHGREPDRAWRAFESHLSRAKWMTAHGYRQLLRGAAPAE